MGAMVEDPVDKARVRLRKRRKDNRNMKLGFEPLLTKAKNAKNIIVFSGSGLSASSGMSMFSTVNGLYQRACKRFGISDGKKLFTWRFYDKQRTEVTSFFVDIHKEAVRAQAGAAHRAVAELECAEKLLRHYTMNVDGLASHSGMTVWSRNGNPDGKIVELHGNARYLICPECGFTAEATSTDLIHMKRYKPRICPACKQSNLRFKIMLYDDEKAELITPEDVWTRFEDDLELADMVVWVGISFEQSASTEYFRKARCFLMDHGRLEQVPQFVINPEDTAFSNLTSTCTNTMALNLWPVYLSADIAMHAIAAAVAQDKERIAELQKAATGELAPIAPAASAELAAVDVPTSGPLTTTGPIQTTCSVSPATTPPPSSSAEQEATLMTVPVAAAAAVALQPPPSIELVPSWGAKRRATHNRRRARKPVTLATEAAIGLAGGLAGGLAMAPSLASEHDAPQLPRPPPLEPVGQGPAPIHGTVQLPQPLPQSPADAALLARNAASHPVLSQPGIGTTSSTARRLSAPAGLGSPLTPAATAAAAAVAAAALRSLPASGSVNLLQQCMPVDADAHNGANGKLENRLASAAGFSPPLDKQHAYNGGPTSAQWSLLRYAEQLFGTNDGIRAMMLKAIQSIQPPAQTPAHASHDGAAGWSSLRQSHDSNGTCVDNAHASPDIFNPDTHPITVSSLYQMPQGSSSAASIKAALEDAALRGHMQHSRQDAWPQQSPAKQQDLLLQHLLQQQHGVALRASHLQGEAQLPLPANVANLARELLQQQSQAQVQQAAPVHPAIPSSELQAQFHQAQQALPFLQHLQQPSSQQHQQQNLLWLLAAAQAQKQQQQQHRA